MKAQHTTGPLTVGRYGTTIVAADGFPLADVDDMSILQNWEELGIGRWSDLPGEAFIERPEGEVEASTRRLVACWNACQGLGTEAVESINLEATPPLATLEIKRLDGVIACMSVALRQLLSPTVSMHYHQEQLGEKCACWVCARAKGTAALAMAEPRDTRLRASLAEIWDTIPGSLSCTAMEALFFERTAAAGIDQAVAKEFLMAEGEKE